MRIAVPGSSRSGSHPGTVQLINSLVAAGHDVVFVSVGRPEGRVGEIVSEAVHIDTRWPRRRGWVSAGLRKLNPGWLRMKVADRRMRGALNQISPDVVYPTDARLARLADGEGLPVSVDPKLDVRVANDFALMVGDESGSLPDPAPRGGTTESPPEIPPEGRHAGRHVVLSYNPTVTNPGRYLRSALERAGVTVDHRYPDVDLDSVPENTDAVVVVESPYPAPRIRGRCRSPLLYWVHHGEHHLFRNIRLARQHKADVVLMAHSWHLGHRFPMPTVAFPFGVPLEMITESIPWRRRSIDVAMVGAGFDSDAVTYGRRRRMAEDVEREVGAERARFSSGLSPEEVFATYGDARVVVDEGGELHRPITMRVFEAMGSGAALLTQPAPGMEKIFGDSNAYMPLDVDDVVGSIRLDDTAERVAENGRALVLGSHTYDHRVDRLLEIALDTPKINVTSEVLPALFGDVVRGFAEIDSIACGDAAAEAWRTTTYLTRTHREILGDVSMVDAVIVADEDALQQGLVDRAQRFVVCSTSHTSTVRMMLEDADRPFGEDQSNGISIFDLGTPGYLVRDAT